MIKQSCQILTLSKILLIWGLFLPLAYPLSTDKDKDIEILSDAAVLDNRDNVSIYTGNVVVNKGSIQIKGERITLFFTNDRKLEKIIVEGQNATFRQLPDYNDEYDEAEAEMIEYREADGFVVLTGEASVHHDGNILSAGKIEYDTELSKVRVNTSISDNESEKVEGERVRLIIPSGRIDLSVDGD